MRRRLMLRNASSGGILPTEYQQVEWIQNTNRAYFFLSGLHPDGIDVTLSANELEMAGYGAFGYYTSDDAFEMQSYGGSIWLFYGKPTMLSYDVGSVIASPTNIQILDRKLYINGAYIATSTNVPTNPNNRNFGVFSIYTSSGAYSSLNGTKIYKMKLYREGGLIVDLIPCYRKSDSAAGMYDTISQTFFTNAGFTKGADVN